MQILCALDDIPDNTGRGFLANVGGEPRPLVVVRRGRRVYGYLNTCPHRGTTLDWIEDRFMDSAGEYLRCATHDAKFRVEDGFCVSGPCFRRSLFAVALDIVNGEVVMT